MDIVVSGSSTAYRDYVYAGSVPVAVDVPGNGASGFHYFQTDQQGSIAEITNGSGQVSVNESFTAFGALRNPATWSGSPTSGQLSTITGITQHAYTFQRMLGEQMGLNDMVGRVEDAVIGRFLSADPTTPNPYDPQSYNPYSYTNNNPLTYVDPTGFTKTKYPNQNLLGGGGGIVIQSPCGLAIFCSYTNLRQSDGTLATFEGIANFSGYISWLDGRTPPPTAFSPPSPQGGQPQTNQPKTTLQPVTVTATRLPDFVHFSLSFPLENEFTGRDLGWGFTVTVDRYGDVYISLNGVAGAPTAKGGSAMVGWMNSLSTPTQSQLSGMLSSWGGGVQWGFGGFGAGFYGNSSGTSESGGYSTSGVSIYGGYTLEMPSLVSPWVHW